VVLGGELFHVGVEHAFLLKVVGHGVLGEKRRLQLDLGPNPLAFAVRLVRGMVAAAAAAKLWTKTGALNLFEGLNFAPGRIADGPGDVDFEVQGRHVVALWPVVFFFLQTGNSIGASYAGTTDTA